MEDRHGRRPIDCYLKVSHIDTLRGDLLPSDTHKAIMRLLSIPGECHEIADDKAEDNATPPAPQPTTVSEEATLESPEAREQMRNGILAEFDVNEEALQSLSFPLRFKCDLPKGTHPPPPPLFLDFCVDLYRHLPIMCYF